MIPLTQDPIVIVKVNESGHPEVAYTNISPELVVLSSNDEGAVDFMAKGMPFKLKAGLPNSISEVKN